MSVHDEWPYGDPFEVVLQGVIYERISCGDNEASEDYCNSGEGLNILVAEKVPLQCLKIVDFSDCYAQELDDLFVRNTYLLASIPRIEYKGSVEKLKLYSRMAVFDRIKYCDLNVSSTVDIIPPNVKKIDFKSVSSTQLTHTVSSWPTTLTSMLIDGDADVNHFELPETLKNLICRRLHNLWRTFPQGLEHLYIVNGPHFPLDDSTLPNLLQKLHVTECYMTDIGKLLSKLPRNLKILDISHNPIESLSNLGFPPFLEEINVGHCKLTTIDGIVLPKLLRRLHLNNNNITSLRNAMFPDLKFLNISENMLKSMSRVNLPSTLRTLLAEVNVSKTGPRRNFLKD